MMFRKCVSVGIWAVTGEIIAIMPMTIFTRRMSVR